MYAHNSSLAQLGPSNYACLLLSLDAMRQAWQCMHVRVRARDYVCLGLIVRAHAA